MPYQSAGEMAEWSIALPWKGSNWATGSGVRIPVSPPALFATSIFFVNINKCLNFFQLLYFF
jgi:hypothetical protein